LCVVLALADRVPLVELDPVLDGIDVVALHVVPHVSTPLQGHPTLAYNFTGFQFWFSTDQHRALFKDNPWRYAPAYGGYAANGIATQNLPNFPWSKKFLGPSVDTMKWKIYNGRLFFTQSDKATQDFFGANAARNIKTADTRWEIWWGSLFAGPFNAICTYPNDCITNGTDYSMHFETLDRSDLDPGYYVVPDFTDKPNSDALWEDGGILLVSLIVVGCILLCLVPGMVVYCVRTRCNRSPSYMFHTGEEEPPEAGTLAEELEEVKTKRTDSSSSESFSTSSSDSSSNSSSSSL